jgi:hypothetical protein
MSKSKKDALKVQEEREKKERAECTFKPQINKKDPK